MIKKFFISTSIEHKLKKKFSPTELIIHDVSEMHRGHAGFKEGGESHFIVKIKSNYFKDMTKLEIHRLINEALKEEWALGVHSISIQTEF
tara:strand:- start:3069 stop:3338 length:270 start_codon:yes stop_codon:yes gene_type:complete